MMAARYAATQRVREEPAPRPRRTAGVQGRQLDDTDADCAALQRLVAYTSKEAHICVEKAARICLVQLRILQTDSAGSLRGDTLREAMEQDEQSGLVPCFVCATLGTPSCCSFDNLGEIAAVCRHRPGVWLHVDAAYAGNALLCPEFRYLADGVADVHSVNVSPHKWLPVNFDCACFWVRDYLEYIKGFVVDALYLKHEHESTAIDFRHWGIPLSRRFRALKLWFTMRVFGIAGLQHRIYKHCSLAKLFMGCLGRDKRFRVMNDVRRQRGR